MVNFGTSKRPQNLKDLVLMKSVFSLKDAFELKTAGKEMLSFERHASFCRIFDRHQIWALFLATPCIRLGGNRRMGGSKHKGGTCTKNGLLDASRSWATAKAGGKCATSTPCRSSRGPSLEVIKLNLSIDWPGWRSILLWEIRGALPKREGNHSIDGGDLIFFTRERKSSLFGRFPDLSFCPEFTPACVVLC